MGQRTVFTRLESVADHRQAMADGRVSPHLEEAILPPANYLQGSYLEQIAKTHPEMYDRVAHLVERVVGGSRERMG